MNDYVKTTTPNFEVHTMHNLLRWTHSRKSTAHKYSSIGDLSIVQVLFILAYSFYKKMKYFPDR